MHLISNSYLKILSIGLFLFCFACQQDSESPQTIEDFETELSNFALYDHKGDFHELYYKSDASAVVLFIHGNACPIVRNAIPDLKKIRESYAAKGVEFLLLNSNLQDNRAAIAEEADEFDMDFPILVDEAQLVAEMLQLKRTAETIVLDPATWEIIYRGPISDRIGYESQKPKAKHTYLIDALDAQLKGEVPSVQYQKGKGCLIKLKHKDRAKFANISYEHDVAPILLDKCVQCHVEGGIAPWAMTDYEQINGWSHMIREVLRVKRMPPWQADPEVGHFANDLSLTNKELQTLVHWIDAGAEKDSDNDPLKAYQPTLDEWVLGKPDWEITLNKEVVPATGVIDYRYQEFEVGLDKDVWATAIQVKPDNKAVLHHLLVSVIYPDGFKEPINRSVSPWLDGVFASWAPGGLDVEKFPKNTGRVLPKGSKLHFQLHYTTNGKEEVDQSKIGIYYTDKEPAKEFLIAGPRNFEILIPPNEDTYKNQTTKVFDQEITLFGLAPHMHFRGKSMKYTAVYPSGEEEVLLNVPNYSFNWQRYYNLKNPKVLPAGTKIVIDAAFDNSDKNSFNPDPSKSVHWGDFSFDEMLIGYMSFQYGKRGELSMNEK